MLSDNHSGVKENGGRCLSWERTVSSFWFLVFSNPARTREIFAFFGARWRLSELRFARSECGLSTKGHEEHLNTFLSAEDAEGRGGARRTPLQGHNLGCPRRAGENTFFIHEGPRRKPLQGHNLGCPRRRAENTFFIHEGSRRVTKNTFFGSTKSSGGRRWAAKKTFCGRRRRLWSQNSRVRRETARLCSQASCFCHILNSLPQVSTTPSLGNHGSDRRGCFRPAQSPRSGGLPAWAG